MTRHFCTLALILMPMFVYVAAMKQFEKMGRLEELSSSIEAWGYHHLQGEIAPEMTIDDLQLRGFVFREGRLPRRRAKESLEEENSSFGLAQNESQHGNWPKAADDDDDGQLRTGHQRLIKELLDQPFYDLTVHPRRNFRQSTRVNLSLSLYQILEVNERRQSITVNVWMVQNWFDEVGPPLPPPFGNPCELWPRIKLFLFLDWDPAQFEGINRTIVPYQQIWVPDTVLYNSELMDRRETEALMNVIVETGHWRGDGQGAAVQLMFPAIYKLSCRMNVRFFPYDQQNCSFIISSWTHDSSIIDYHFDRPTVNLLNFAQNDEWTVISFEFERVQEHFKCCPNPWTMLYAHLVIRRKPLYYIVNLVLPTSIITIVAVTGFFTPSSSSSERNEKLYLGINTLMTMMLMLLMVTNQMPNTSNYVPLMSWYYMGIIGTCALGTLMATVVLFLHARNIQCRPLPRSLLRWMLLRPWLWAIVLEPPANLKEIWMEYGLLKQPSRRGEGQEKKEEEPPHSFDQLLQQGFAPPHVRGGDDGGGAGGRRDDLRHERRLALATRRLATMASRTVGRERRRRETIVEAADFLAKGVFGNRKRELHQMQRRISLGLGAVGGPANAQLVKRQKMMRRCALEWEYLANCVDRCLLAFFGCLTAFFFSLLAFYEQWNELRLKMEMGGNAHRNYTK